MRDLERTSTLSIAPAAPRPARVLVIEDNRHVRRLLGDLLRTWGYEADVAPDGREGLARFAPGAYDMVLTDLSMPHLSGLEVVAGLRDRDRSVALILLTAAPQDLDHERRRLGFRVLRKPMDIEGLRQAVRESVAGPGPA
jgi:two-component system capsular synthesis sensor histidine kinase RcsC